MAADGETSKRITVISVHGTGDAAPTPKSEKWWEQDSPFCINLKQELAKDGISIDYRPFKWSGANNVVDREKAAEALSRDIRRATKSQEIHVIGHSHGGNVANDAAVYLRWGKKGRPPSIASLTTVGTPYFKTGVSTFQRYGAYFFMAIAIFGALVLGAIGIGSLVYYNMTFEDALLATTLLIAALLAGGFAFYLMIREAMQGVRRVSRPGSLRSEAARIFCVWHPADEAIGLLDAVETIKIEPFAPGSMFRGSRTGGILWAVRITIALVFLAFAFLIAHAAGAGDAIEAGLASMRLAQFGAWLNTGDCEGMGCLGLTRGDWLSYLFAAILLLAIIAVVWMLIYGVYRLVVGLVFEFALRGILNKSIADVFRGMAFGSVGDQRPLGVQSWPVVFEHTPMQLDGELADRIAAKAQSATNAMLDNYRKGLFGGEFKKSLEDLQKDDKTWNSLIHTTYFDQPEVAAFIARHIAAAHARR